jgi:hypothetical protein
VTNSSRRTLLGLFLLAVALPLAAVRYEQGQRIQITGMVSDAQGQPIQGVRVTLEASRSSFSLREFRRTDKDLRKVSAVTGANGEYSLEWPWDSYFNKFELAAGVPVRVPRSGERLEELAREDLTRKVLAGSPVVASLVIQNRAFVDNLRAFVASVQSADERRVYEEMGRPDRVKRTQYSDHVESSWWYFESGRMYSFRDGRLEQVVPFDPVRGR